MITGLPPGEGAAAYPAGASLGLLSNGLRLVARSPGAAQRNNPLVPGGDYRRLPAGWARRRSSRRPRQTALTTTLSPSVSIVTRRPQLLASSPV